MKTSKPRPIIMLRKKSPPKIEKCEKPIVKQEYDEPPVKTRRVESGSMSPDSGWGDYSSDGASSPAADQQVFDQSASQNQPNQLDMSTMIEQAFTRSVGEVPTNVQIPSPTTSDFSTDVDLFDQLDLSELTQNPAWEELDIDSIEPSFTSDPPFLNL